ncbi:hypothetical protein SAMN04487948_13719 [Halogranum amylolyticum]|uniref:DUF4129 domain-containing protein n=1 Tax=Halogranum amylolyticum TaxID=660520 RepID=A0A1H8WRY8_9EURY|nr:carboxypeptidase-like regulatory domain-containing protein [Halogranum amylolyticum]SEP29848.1 hypothetical protein SAMN04487948_13719 [Halogranum amylolyticum]
MTPWLHSQRRVFLLLVLIVALLSFALPPAAATTAASHPQSSEASARSSIAASGFQQQNNTTVQHENPEATNQDGNLGQVEAHLSRVLAERLGESTVQLNQEEYQQARQLTGDEYSDALAKYIDVAGETGNEQTAERFEQAQSTQQEYTNTVREFQQTHDEYQEAKQNGNEERARELARELTRLAERSNSQSTQLSQSYTSLSNQTGANFTESQESVDEIQNEISTQEQTALEEEFTPTELTVDESQSAVSFQDPLELSGRLVTEDGEPLAERTIQLKTPGRNVTTTTDEDGQFSLSYRPTVLPLTADNVTVRYVPEPSSIYLGANESMDISVTQTNATLSIESAPTTTAYQEEITIRGETTVETTPVAGLPVSVSLGSIPLGTAQTTETGEFELQTRLPAGITADTHDLQVRVGVQERAVTAAPVRQSVQVESTPTALTLATNESHGRTVPVSGQFQTTDGDTIGGQELEFRVNGTLVGTATTTPNGTYHSQVQIPKTLLDGGATTLQLSTVYTGTGTNLERASARTMVTVHAGGSNQSSPLETESPLVYWVGGTLIGIILLGGGAFLYLRRSSTATSTATETDTFATNDGESSSSPEPDLSLLALARRRVARGETEAAVEAAYEALRQQIIAILGLGSSVTHWELYQAYQTQIGSDESSLHELVRRYEQVAYGKEKPSEDEATTVIDLSAAMVHAEDQTPDSDD